VQSALREATNYRNDIGAGEERIRQIRQYLDVMEILPAEPTEIGIGSPDAVPTFASFEAWVASFSGRNLGLENEDEFLLRNLKTRKHLDGDCLPESVETTGIVPGSDAPPLRVRLIITDLKLEGESGKSTVEQLYFHSNAEIIEVLRELKDQGMFPDFTLPDTAQDIPV